MRHVTCVADKRFQKRFIQKLQYIRRAATHPSESHPNPFCPYRTIRHYHPLLNWPSCQPFFFFHTNLQSLRHKTDHVCNFIATTFYISLANFVQIAPPSAELWRYSDSQRGGKLGQPHCNSTSAFVFCDFAQLGRSKCKPNFGEISLSAGEILLLYFRFVKTNIRHVIILLSGSIFTSVSSSACHSAAVYQIFSKSDHSRQMASYPFLPRELCYSAVLAIVILSACPSVCLLHAWIVTKLNDALRIFWYRTKGNHSATLVPRVVGGRRPLPSEICPQIDPALRNATPSTDFRL